MACGELRAMPSRRMCCAPAELGRAQASAGETCREESWTVTTSTPTTDMVASGSPSRDAQARGALLRKLHMFPSSPRCLLQASKALQTSSRCCQLQAPSGAHAMHHSTQSGAGVQDVHASIDHPDDQLSSDSDNDSAEQR